MIRKLFAYSDYVIMYHAMFCCILYIEKFLVISQVVSQIVEQYLHLISAILKALKFYIQGQVEEVII